MCLFVRLPLEAASQRSASRAPRGVAYVDQSDTLTDVAFVGAEKFSEIYIIYIYIVSGSFIYRVSGFPFKLKCDLFKKNSHCDSYLNHPFQGHGEFPGFTRP